jgi:hypothetical protein
MSLLTCVNRSQDARRRPTTLRGRRVRHRPPCARAHTLTLAQVEACQTKVSQTYVAVGSDENLVAPRRSEDRRRSPARPAPYVVHLHVPMHDAQLVHVL